MAESFSNSVKRAVGIVSTVSSSATVGISTNRITGFTLNTGVVAVGDMVLVEQMLMLIDIQLILLKQLVSL